MPHLVEGTRRQITRLSVSQEGKNLLGKFDRVDESSWHYLLACFCGVISYGSSLQHIWLRSSLTSTTTNFGLIHYIWRLCGTF